MFYKKYNNVCLHLNRLKRWRDQKKSKYYIYIYIYININLNDKLITIIYLKDKLPPIVIDKKQYI